MNAETVDLKAPSNPSEIKAFRCPLCGAKCWNNKPCQCQEPKTKK